MVGLWNLDFMVFWMSDITRFYQEIYSLADAAAEGTTQWNQEWMSDIIRYLGVSSRRVEAEASYSSLKHCAIRPKDDKNVIILSENKAKGMYTVKLGYEQRVQREESE
jgi:hypothetical protein